MMHDGTWWQVLWHTSICTLTFLHTTHRYSLFFLFVLHPGSVLDSFFPLCLWIRRNVNVCLLCACAHTHTQVQYVHRHTNTCTHRDRHVHTHRACLLLLWWLRAVKTSSLSLPLSYQSSLTELVYAGSQRLLSIPPHSVFISTSSSHCPLVHLSILILCFSSRLLSLAQYKYCICICIIKMLLRVVPIVYLTLKMCDYNIILALNLSRSSHRSYPH